MMLNWKNGTFSLECEKCVHTNKLPLAQTIRLIDHHHKMELYRKRERIIKTLGWLVDKHQYYLCLRNNAPDDPSEYPEELQEAIDLLAELKGENL